MVGYTLTVKDVPSSTSIFEDAGCVGTTRSELEDVALVTKLMAHDHFYVQKNNGWASWIRTSASRSQSPLPYRLAIAQRDEKETLYSIAIISQQSGKYTLFISANHP